MNMKKIGTAFLAVVLCVSALSISVFAKEGTSALDLLTGIVETENTSEFRSVSPALQVIADQSSMAIAGIKGNMLNFSAERFACAMNLSNVQFITVTSLPDIRCGALYLGSEGISVGQKIKAEQITLMTYEEASSGVGQKTSFRFRVEESAYEMTCNIYMIDGVNYCPTVSMASEASLHMETYKDIRTSGLLSAYDPEGDKLTFEVVQYPINGRLIIEDSSVGSYTYIPNEGFTGEDSFKYVACDQYGNYSAWKEISLRVMLPGVNTVYQDLLDDPLHSHAIAMTECGIMNGVQVGEHYYFEADREVSRAEFVVMAMNAIGLKNLPAVESTGFADDDKINAEMKGYIALAYQKGYISGKTIDGALCFAPNESIKLSEASVIISNMIGYAEPKVTPVFADAVPSWSQKAINSLYTLGILEAPEMISAAGEYLTRGEMAKLLNKTMHVIGK